MSRARTDPSSLLPEPFRNPSAPQVDAVLKDAVDDAQDAVENVSKELAVLAASPGRKASTPLAAAKAERDETRKRIAALGPRGRRRRSGPGRRDLGRRPRDSPASG